MSRRTRALALVLALGLVAAVAPGLQLWALHRLDSGAPPPEVIWLDPTLLWWGGVAVFPERRAQDCVCGEFFTLTRYTLEDGPEGLTCGCYMTNYNVDSALYVGPAIPERLLHPEGTLAPCVARSRARSFEIAGLPQGTEARFVHVIRGPTWFRGR